MKKSLKWGAVLLGICDLGLAVWKINASRRISLLGFSNVTEKTWPDVARRISDLRTERRHAEEAKYDPQKTGHMAPELLGTYHQEHALLVKHEMANVERSLLRRGDRRVDTIGIYGKTAYRYDEGTVPGHI